MSELYIGLMSGTSLDGIDGVLADFSGPRMTVLQHASAPFAPELRAELLALNTPGENELHRAALAGNGLSRAYASVVHVLLQKAGLDAGSVRAIGAHGQTVRHRPQEFDGTGYTLQLGNPSLLAELTGITVAADFRSRDVAAGGQGAPLVPAFHQGVFGRAGETVLVLNIGGISNLSVLGQDGSVLGFDCGPGNALMDHWCQRHTGNAFDAGGQWAASGRVAPELLSSLLQEPYLQKPAPKSTGRDLFNPDWLNSHLQKFPSLAPVDVQATLTEFTASTCAISIKGHQQGGISVAVCGGGALNDHLMHRLQVACPALQVVSTDSLGLPALQVEAAAFAWLAYQRVRLAPGNLPSVTGASSLCILGALHPA